MTVLLNSYSECYGNVHDAEFKQWRHSMVVPTLSVLNSHYLLVSCYLTRLYYLNTSRFFFLIYGVTVCQGFVGNVFYFYSPRSLMMSTNTFFCLVYGCFNYMWYSTGFHCIICTELKNKKNMMSYYIMQSARNSFSIGYLLEEYSFVYRCILTFLQSSFLMYSKVNKL